ncbi:hypothetical protein BKN38_08615 [Helicobacter sp. CLO-3]|uniref:methyltransferase domain-containing protein n=1 Tax=unclassified Helicobacter TaxID=2593540 RepID=UPI000805B5C8|nr:MULTISPECIES: methyltransferase domain-containing protein [unclassified Helicobacter]OBV29141.1 hypothetical protein BA723_06640 [Helicobacter sp. CLO-3]OHU81636.1 hypothetical protein BKN38_08615 [Helicobacter sp. CLO-3]
MRDVDSSRMDSSKVDSGKADFRRVDSSAPSANAIKSSFWHAKESYKDAAIVQAMMRENLLKLLKVHIKRDAFARVFEFGAGSGDFSEALQAAICYQEFVCNDINNHTEALLARLDSGARAKNSIENSAKNRVEIFDMNHLARHKIGTQKFDLIASNACLQWLNAREILPTLARMLEREGVLLLSSFGRQNLREVREILGVSLEYLEAREIGAILENLGLEICALESEKITLDFGDARGVFRHLRQSGVNAFGINNARAKSASHAKTTSHTKSTFCAESSASLDAENTENLDSRKNAESSFLDSALDSENLDSRARKPIKKLTKKTLLEYEKRFGGRITYEPIYILAKKQS